MSPSPLRGPHARVELLLGPHEQRLEADGAAAAQRQQALQHTHPRIIMLQRMYVSIRFQDAIPPLVEL